MRPDGGSGTQCDGSEDAPYPGRGRQRHCAWSNLSWALASTTEWKIRGGDRLLIAPGSYRMGWGGESGWKIFDGRAPAEVHLPPLPSGRNATVPTVLAGSDYTTGCARRPELWGARGAHHVLDLSGVSNVLVACLEVTDHATCGVRHPTLRCGPEDDFATAGIYADDDRGTNVVLRDLQIHGLAAAGITGRFGSVTLEDVVLGGNAMTGWDTDLKHGTAFDPTVRIERSTIEWNGCVEEAGTRRPAAGGCRGELEGGYGDGIGTDDQGGRWSITDSVIRFNTQDGLDLLYLKQPGAEVRIDRVTAYGNAGNQIKVAGRATITNSVIVADCAFFDGKPFSMMRGYFSEDAAGYHRGDHCRANGDALVVTVQSGVQSRIVNNTIAGEGDFLIWGLCQNRDETPCGGASGIEIVNNILRGYRRAGEFRDRKLGRSGRLVGPLLAENGVVRGLHHNLLFQVDRAYGDFHGTCPLGPGDICADPRFAKDVLSEAFAGSLLPDSPAIDAGVTMPGLTNDHEGAARPQGPAPDLGAFEFAGGRR